MTTSTPGPITGFRVEAAHPSACACGHRLVLAATADLLDHHSSDAPVTGALLDDLALLRDGLATAHLTGPVSDQVERTQVREAVDVLDGTVVESLNLGRYGDTGFVPLLDDVRRRVAELDGRNCPSRRPWPRRI